jgi:dihydroxy-acid dehydratase
VRLIKQGIRPSMILTRKAFENAITVVIALGGSTNAVLHLLAIAHAAGVPLELDDFTRIGARVPGARRPAPERALSRCRN